MTSALTKDQTYEILCRYIDKGFGIVPIWGIDKDGHCMCPKGTNCDRSPGKHPNARLATNGVKSSTRNKHTLHGWIHSAPYGNWAVATGEPLTGGGFSICADVDFRNGGDVSLAQIQGAHGQFPETLMQRSGGGGPHYLFYSSTPVQSTTLAPGIDLLGAGKYFLVEPSKHPSGGVYKWENDAPIAPAPEWMLEEAGAAAIRPARLGDGTARDTVLGEAFALSERLGVPFPDGTIAVHCPWADMHTDNRGRGSDSGTVILPPAGGSNFGGFKCMHSHCADRKWNDVINALPPSAADAARRKFPFRPVDVNEAAVEPPIANAPPDPFKMVREKLEYNPTKGGGYKLKSDIVNAVTILSFDPRWEGILSYDEFAQSLVFTRPPGWHVDDKPSTQLTVWTDPDSTLMDAWMRRNWGLELKEESLVRAAILVGRKSLTNPLREYLDSLKWDGVKRLDTWTHDYLGAAKTPYHSLVGRMWMISAVARGYQPGCKADHCLILEGPQGRGKSTALRILAGGKRFFSDTPLDLGNKDAYLSLRGKWIIELAELASTKGREVERVKAFFSSAVDYYRPPFGRTPLEVPRSCVFAGTVNPTEYLSDETGNRRFWPVKCGVIDNDGLEAVRDQLWAEAVNRFQSNEPWWPQFADREMIELEQELRTFDCADNWTEAIRQWANSKTGRETIARQGGVTSTQVLQHGVGLQTSDMTRFHATRVCKIMQVELGWDRWREKAGQRRWLYTPKT